MTKASESERARNAIVKARTQLIIGEPFFGCLALHLDVREIHPESHLAKACETMAVDGVHMYYWPEFVLGLSEDELKGVIAHEVLHCAYQHMTRRQSRHPPAWNTAGDFVINADLLEAGFKLPGPAVTVGSPPGTKGHLFDPKFKGMSTEEIYERLPKVYITFVGSGDPGGCGGVMDAPNGGSGEGDDKEGDGNGANSPDIIKREWEVNVRMAVNVAKGSNAGQLPGYLKRLVQQLEQPKIDWREKTRNWIDQSMTKDYSWSRPNRRYISRGLVLPGHIPDAIHHLVMAIDTSGSISGPLLTAMVSEGAGALNQGVADKLTIIYADAQVQHVTEYLPGDLVQPEPKGGGGTDFQDTFEWIKHHAEDATCVVYLTDMMTCSFGEDPGCPVLWGAYLPQQMLDNIHPPFGEVVVIDTARQ